VSGVVALVISLAVAVGSASGVPERTFSSELSYRDRGAQVAELNESLAAAGFHPDTGRVFGRKTRHAVYAFQKHHGLATTGKFTPFMWSLLEVQAELPLRADGGRVEVDLERQVLYVVEDHEVVLIIPISSGNEGTYRTESGNVARARTPEGAFRFQRRISGMREAFLGQMYNPYYFLGGYAIHGSPSVPNYPASHGCIRVTMWDMDLLLDHFQVGMRVYVYGKRTAPPPPEPKAPERRRFV
jgi:hypothetical protein